MKIYKKACLGVNKGKSGFTLLETLLSGFAIAVIFAGLISIMNGWAEKAVNTRVADEMNELLFVAEQYTKLNFEDVLSGLTLTPANTKEIEIDDLISSGFLSSTYTARNSFKQALRVLVFRENDTINGDTIGVLVVGDNEGGNRREEDSRLFDAAHLGGPSLGVISSLDLGSCCNGNVQNVEGAWSVPLDRIDDEYNTVPDARGGYMAAYTRVSISPDTDLSDEVMHRISVPGKEELNKMETDLRMSGNNIANVGVLTADAVGVSGALKIEGNQLNDPVSSAFVLSVAGNTKVNNDIALGDAAIAGKGNLIINNVGNLEDALEITNNLRMGNGYISANSATVGRLKNEMPLNLATSSNVTVNNDTYLDPDAEDYEAPPGNMPNNFRVRKLSSQGQLSTSGSKIDVQKLQTANINNSKVIKAPTVTANGINILNASGGEQSLLEVNGTTDVGTRFEVKRGSNNKVKSENIRVQRELILNKLEGCNEERCYSN